MLNKIRLYLIKLLKAKPNERFEEFRAGCESWANEFMEPKPGYTPVRACYYFPFGNEKIVFTESRKNVNGGVILSAYFAPWVKDCSLMNTQITGSNETLQR